VIFGRKITKHYRGKLQTEIEDMNLPNPVIRSHYGNGFIKQYIRDHLILRTESASNNVNDYGVNKAVENLPVLRETLSAIKNKKPRFRRDSGAPTQGTTLPIAKLILGIVDTTCGRRKGCLARKIRPLSVPKPATRLGNRPVPKRPVRYCPNRAFCPNLNLRLS
jgi:hypothetical protein